MQEAAFITSGPYACTQLAAVETLEAIKQNLTGAEVFDCSIVRFPARLRQPNLCSELHGVPLGSASLELQEILVQCSSVA